MNLDFLGVKLQAVTSDQEFLYVMLVAHCHGWKCHQGLRTHNFALVALQLNDFAHITVYHDGAIASEFLLDDSENLLSVKLVGQSLDGGLS